jgi:hypothetical protein
MKRFRISTLMLLIAIVAFCLALGLQQYRANQRDAEFRRMVIELFTGSNESTLSEEVLIRFYHASETRAAQADAERLGSDSK